MTLIYKYDGADSKLSIGRRIYFNSDRTMTTKKNKRSLSYGVIVVIPDKTSFAIDRHHFKR